MNTVVSWGLSPSEQTRLAQQPPLAGARFIALREEDLAKRLEEVTTGVHRTLQDLHADPKLQQMLRRVPEQELPRIEAMMSSPSSLAEILPQLTGWTYLLWLLPREQLSPAITAAKALLPRDRLIFSAVTPLALSWFTGDYLFELQQEHLLMRQWSERRRSVASADQQLSPQKGD